MRFGPLPEEDVSPVVCIRLDSGELVVLLKCSSLVYAHETLRIGEILVVMHQFVAERPEYVFEMTAVYIQCYHIRFRIVVSCGNERVENFNFAVVDLYLWNWVDLYTAVPIELFYF